MDNLDVKIENVEIQPKKDNVLLQYGLISALASILFYVALYLMGAETFMKPVAYFSYVIPIAFAVLAAIKAKKAEGFLPYGKALKIVFGIFVITFFALSLFSFILNNYIDTAFAERMLQLTIQKTQEMMQKFNVPQAEIEKQIKNLMSMDMFSFGSVMKGFLYQCIMLFLLSLIIAAIVKKNKPEFTA